MDKRQGADSVAPRRCEKQPRDVLAERITKWAGDAGVYDYADRLINDLFNAGWEITPELCLAEGCTEELGAHCDTHGYVLYGGGKGAHMEKPTAAQSNGTDDE
jgi:predicted Rossmann-fold nucleotide-binding protein